jgi:RNA polymerase sigma-70 factor (ECF subfamily)
MVARDFPALVARAATGDEAAASQLHRELTPGLTRHFERKTPRGAAHTVDDLVQRTWIEFFRCLREGKYDPARAAASTFLYAIASNVWLRHARESQRTTPSLHGPEVIDAIGSALDESPQALAHAIDAVRSIVEGRDAGGGFSDAERDMLRGIGDGESERDHARRAGISPSTAHERRGAVIARVRERLIALKVDLGSATRDRAFPPHPAKKE